MITISYVRVKIKIFVILLVMFFVFYDNQRLPFITELILRFIFTYEMSSNIKSILKFLTILKLFTYYFHTHDALRQLSPQFLL